MTTWKVNPASAVPPAKGGMDDDLLDMMAALDALPTEKRSAPQRKAAPAAKAEPIAPVFVQQWFPKAIVCHGTHQDCKCGQQWDSIDGLFLEDQHRNGATRQVRVEANVVPPEYYGLPTRQQFSISEIPFCAICFQTEFKVPEPELPADLIRALSQDDLNSLKEES